MQGNFEGFALPGACLNFARGSPRAALVFHLQLTTAKGLGRGCDLNRFCPGQHPFFKETARPPEFLACLVLPDFLGSGKNNNRFRRPPTAGIQTVKEEYDA